MTATNPTKNEDLHGNAPDSAPVALVLVDMINDLEFEGGEALAELLQPEKDDYFVLKPKHSAFYATTLDTLLDYLGPRRLIVTGITGDVCVLFTASDAYMRDFHLHVPADCIASIAPEHTRDALEYMERVLRVDTTPSMELDLDALARESRRRAKVEK